MLYSQRIVAVGFSLPGSSLIDYCKNFPLFYPVGNISMDKHHPGHLLLKAFKGRSIIFSSFGKGTTVLSSIRQTIKSEMEEVVKGDTCDMDF